MESMCASKFYSPQQLSQLDPKKIPRHVAIIPDGNRRWAKKMAESDGCGHHVGASNLIEIVKAAKEIGIKFLTFYLFSTENWSRSVEEVNGLMWLLQEFLKENCAEMQQQGVRLRTIGNLSTFSPEVLTVVKETVEATAHCDSIDMILALNYGSRDELKRAFQKMLNDYTCEKFKKEDVTEKLISSYLDTNLWTDPELLIRTSGELRISNFLLWQLSYAEIYVTDLLWPEFKPDSLFDAVANFQKRKRRLGGT